LDVISSCIIKEEAKRNYKIEREREREKQYNMKEKQ